MEGLMNLAIYFILGFCVFTAISAGSVEDITTESPKTDFNDLMRQGSFVGNITASKDGANLRFKIKSKIEWNDAKGMCKNSGNSSGVREDLTTMAPLHKGHIGLIPTPDHKEVIISKGDKGDIGPIGLLGMKGSDGIMGSRGDTGPTGPPGTKGDKGDIGPIGLMGIRGLNGVKGDKGDEGRTGLPGGDGGQGPKGDKGDSGPSGPPGEQGADGKDCEGLSAAESKYGYEGAESNPAYSCSSISDDGSFYINPAKKFEVDCKEYKTCIQISDSFKTSDFSTTAYEFKNKKGFWLSSLNFTVNDFYKQSFSNLLYLMTKSESFKLTMKYHCFNSPVESLKILTWNGNIIDNIGGVTTPIHFEIPNGTNGCKDAKKDELKSSVIQIESNIASYLPVDFYIGDIIGDTVQKIYIELTSLCFK